MKKFVSLLVFSVVLCMVSCGGQSQKEVDSTETDTVCVDTIGVNIIDVDSLI